MQLDIDVPSVYRVFSYLLNDEPFPISAYDDGDFHVVGAGEGNSVDVGETWHSILSAWLVAGEYDIVSSVRNQGISFPPTPGASSPRTSCCQSLIRWSWTSGRT